MARPFVGDAGEVLYRLMLEIDKHEDLDKHPIRESKPYEQAVEGLGWNIDWAAKAEERMERGY